MYGQQRSVLDADDAFANAIAYQAGNIVDLEPIHQSCAMRLDGLDAEIELAGNSGSGKLFRNQL